MPRLKLTKSAIDALPTPSKDTVYWDSGCPGFGVKTTPKARRVFIVLYRTGGAGSRLRKYTIGPHGRVTLHQARAVALKIFAARTEGRDPAAEKQQARRRLVADRVEELVELFIAEHVSKTRSAREISRLLRREVVPCWGMRSIHEISKRHVIELVTEVAARGTPSAANKLLKVVKTFFGWCVGRAILDLSPAAQVRAPARERARDRLLDDDELVRIIRAARQVDGPYAGIVELLALTGQRREEVAQVTWDELDLASQSWTLASRTKNGKPHIVHLSKEAIAVLMRRPRLGKFVFSLSGTKAFQGFSAAKRELDQLSQVTGWRLHDLRRTCVSGMARLGVAPHVADKVLNHQSGTISGVAAVYQRHEFLVERKDALERWGTHVAGLLKHAERLVA
ncbi:MAG TPA: integrase [Rhizobiales bacterium]|nr:integrase [Hyphomicrobiales bacterium]